MENHDIKKTYLYRLFRGGILILHASTFSQPVQAIAVTFDLSQFTDGVTSTSITNSGITLTASNFAPTTNSKSNSDGLCFFGSLGSFCGYNGYVKLTFSAPVQLLSYKPGNVSNTANRYPATFSQNSNYSAEINFVDEQVTNFNNQFVALGNQGINVSAYLNGNTGSLQIRELTVETQPAAAVPEPLTIMGTILAGGLGVAMKKKKARQL
ncbi:PEP-CTERM sorting domain-containing protein [Geminocystis sp. GBBB08]|uniref:PEP-CTERM sorting domain-containing protein n=1 Tax=Geminocystis sp. GBBB08 TaxID=2604140 RepID=UPI0027E2C251|nr:PEP-CTERM sorting domain-containing protein [Geminocystis sp. GBBB08]MBL1208186.1 PEP-CTERM sorting domain-containing protein [Geminocystis sp. GBBB08]